MKRILVAAVLGLSLTAAQNAHSAGHIYFTDYSVLSQTYNPVVWAPTPERFGGVQSGQGVLLNLWYGEGAGLSENQLSGHVGLTWATVFELSGYYGYYSSPEVILPDWQPGDTYTFQVRASGNSVYGLVDESLSRSVLWQEMANITGVGITANTASAPGFFVYIPEPSSVSMMGLGFMTMILAKRRRT